MVRPDAEKIFFNINKKDKDVSFYDTIRVLVRRWKGNKFVDIRGFKKGKLEGTDKTLFFPTVFGLTFSLTEFVEFLKHLGNNKHKMLELLVDEKAVINEQQEGIVKDERKSKLQKELKKFKSRTRKKTYIPSY